MSRAIANTSDLTWLMDESPAPVYVLDDRRRIVYCNAACARWVGAKASDLLGQTCGFHQPPQENPTAAAACGLCPPPGAFAGHIVTGLVSRAIHDGDLRYRRGHFFPLNDGQDESAPVLAILDARDCDGPDSVPADPDAHLHEYLRRFRQELGQHYRDHQLIGSSPAIVKARAQIELAAATRVHVLCVGPRGTGKNQVARTIHYRQADAGPFIPLACGILESNSLRATLRSLWQRQAASESIATLVLQDVERLSGDAQTELEQLLARQSRVRIIASSCQGLAQLLAEPALSPALACSLSTITIELPALAQRIEDLPLLAQGFLEEENAAGSKQLGDFSAEAIDVLTAHPWPGNLDELAAVVHEAHDRARFGRVEVRDLPERISWASEAALHKPRSGEPIDLEEFLGRVERELITRAMIQTKANKSKAARLLGLTRARLYRRLVQLGMVAVDSPESDEES